MYKCVCSAIYCVLASWVTRGNDGLDRWTQRAMVSVWCTVAWSLLACEERLEFALAGLIDLDRRGGHCIVQLLPLGGLPRGSAAHKGSKSSSAFARLSPSRTTSNSDRRRCAFRKRRPRYPSNVRQVALRPNAGSPRIAWFSKCCYEAVY